MVGYVHWRLALPSLTVASLAVWLGYRGVRLLADRVRRGQVDPATLTGRMAWLTRRAYRGVAALPLIGVDKPQYQALYGVNLEIGRGMFGLLGPNGAGKTTLMRIICQVLEPSSGSVAFDSVNVTRHGAVQGLIGYLPQHLGLYEGTPQAMRDLARGHAWEAVVSEEALSRINAQVNVISHLRAPDGIRVRFLAADAVPGIAAVPVEPTLEDAYIYVLRSKEVPGC